MRISLFRRCLANSAKPPPSASTSSAEAKKPTPPPQPTPLEQSKTPQTERLSAITNRSLFEELRWLKTAKKVPHGTREKLNIEFPFAQLTGTVRDVNGTRVPLVGTRALWPSPQLWVVTQKRVFAHQWVDTWRSAVAAMDESHRPLFCELMLVDELLWKLTKRVVERNVASTLPSAVDRTHVLGHYGKLTNDVIAACGGLRYQVLPTALLIDAKGRLRWRTIGVCEQADVEEIATLVQSLNSA